jgi:hypothetical protein
MDDNRHSFKFKNGLINGVITLGYNKIYVMTTNTSKSEIKNQICEDSFDRNHFDSVPDIFDIESIYKMIFECLVLNDPDRECYVYEKMSNSVQFKFHLKIFCSVELSFLMNVKQIDIKCGYNEYYENIKKENGDLKEKILNLENEIEKMKKNNTCVDDIKKEISTTEDVLNKSEQLLQSIEKDFFDYHGVIY